MIFKESNYVNDSIIAYNETNIPVFEKNGKSYIDYDLLEKFSESENIPLKAAYRRVIRYNKLDEAIIIADESVSNILESEAKDLEYKFKSYNARGQLKEIKSSDEFAELKTTFESFKKARNGSDEKMELAKRGLGLTEVAITMARCMDFDTAAEHYYKSTNLAIDTGSGYVSGAIDTKDYKEVLMDQLIALKKIFNQYITTEKQPMFSGLKTLGLF